MIGPLKFFTRHGHPITAAYDINRDSWIIQVEFRCMSTPSERVGAMAHQLAKTIGELLGLPEGAQSDSRREN